jgi:uncharacterized protein with von Willebrand factor type A (vWA) domain
MKTTFCAPWHHAAALPRALWLPAYTCSEGTAELRLQHLRAWLDALRCGELPPQHAHFGVPDAAAALRGVAGELDLPALARGIPAIGEQVLRTLLWHLDRIADLQGPGGGATSRAEAIALTTADFRAAWQQQRVALEAQAAWLRQWADTATLQWDQLQGQLHRREWQVARRAAEQLQRLPELMALIRRLGRRERSAEPPRAAPPRAESGSQRVPLAPVHTVLAGAPGEITGIRFSASIEHMLAVEAVALRHPLLRRLWRARQAEGRLLAHDTAAEVIDWRPDPAATAHAPRPAPQAERQQRGPIVLCLDTSGSMRGAPEQIAKAVALAALQVARAEGRGCRLIAFGGPGEVVERDLHDDLAAVLDLMGQAFDGGTDLQVPIERAMAAIDSGPGWHGADLLIVSDGEFGCRRATLEALDAARARRGLFVQGVLVGDRETMGLLEVCDQIHWVRDWRRFAEGDAASGYSPVHSKSLTALYFPQALSAQAARHGRP